MSDLKKSFGLIHVFAIASGAMISSGLFILPGHAYALAGPSVVLSYFLGGLVALAGALSIAELTTAMPRAGGDYFFITRGIGSGVGTVAGLLSWFSLSLKSAFAIVGMATFAALIVHLNGLVAGLTLCAVFVALNIFGAREAARVQVVLVVGLLALMAVYIVAGITRVEMRHFHPFAPNGLPAVFSTAGFVFVSFGGLLNVASIAEETRNPGRTIPRGLILSLVVVTILYTLMVFVTTGVLPSEDLDHSLTPISTGARATMGQAGYVALSIGAMLAFITTANAGILSASRYLFALSRDRLLPDALTRTTSRFHTPFVAILITGAVIAVALLLPINLVAKAASTVLIVTNILACLCVIVLRESHLQNYRPAFRSPLYPWVQIIGVLALGFVLLEMGEDAYLISGGLALLGVAIYWSYGRRRAQHESALLHLIERVTAKELVTGQLEDELKGIIRQRDEITPDRFDNLIEAAVVLDIDGPLTAGAFFERVAGELAGRLDMNAADLARRLNQREAEGSTVLAPGLAVPHMIVPGQGRFDILLARAPGGITFAESDTPVYTAFVLVGSADERNFHLQALAAIAQIVQEPLFERRWMQARNTQALRDLLLLAARHRH